LTGRRGSSEFAAHFVDINFEPVVVWTTNSHKYVLFKNMD
jgi:hypothetical protein